MPQPRAAFKLKRAVDTSVAPWFDWGPYLWTAGINGRSDGLIWCGGQTTPPTQCEGNYDVRYGNLQDEKDYWGDYTHPSATGQQKVANLLVEFIKGTLPSPQTNISNWIPWITK